MYSFEHYVPSELRPEWVELSESALSALIERSLREFPLPLAGVVPDGVKARMLSLRFEKGDPRSMALLLVEGPAGTRVTFLEHDHPGGEFTQQLRGVTRDPGATLNPDGEMWSPVSSRHQPEGELDADGIYAALVYWGAPTVPVKK